MPRGSRASLQHLLGGGLEGHNRWRRVMAPIGQTGALVQNFQTRQPVFRGDFDSTQAPQLLISYQTRLTDTNSVAWSMKATGRGRQEAESKGKQSARPTPLAVDNPPAAT